MARRIPAQMPVISEPTPEDFSFPNGYAGGIDIQASEELIAANRSPDMMNETLEGGVPKKRYGYDLYYNMGIAQPIRGIFEYEPVGGSVQKLVFVGGRMYKVEG